MGGGCPKRCSFSLFLLLLLFGTNPCLPIGRQKRRRRRRRRREERGEMKAHVGNFPSVPVWKSKCVVVLFENVFSVDGGRRVRPGFGRRRRRAAPPRGHAAAATTTLQPSAFRVSEHEHLQYSLSLSRQELDNLFQRKNYLFNCTKIAYLATQYMLQILNGPKNAKKPLQYSFSIDKTYDLSCKLETPIVCYRLQIKLHNHCLLQITGKFAITLP